MDGDDDENYFALEHNESSPRAVSDIARIRNADSQNFRYSKTLKIRRDEFLSQCKEVHGDRFDYSKVDFKNRSKRIIIICPVHGEFEQSPYNHINRGYGCKKCGDEKRGLRVRSDQVSIIQRFKKVHGDRYDYSKVVYQGNKVPVVIICRVHGEFEQPPERHSGGANCRKCADENRKKVSSAEVRKLFDEGLKRYEIAEKLGIAASTVRRNLKEIAEEENYFEVEHNESSPRAVSDVLRDKLRQSNLGRKRKPHTKEYKEKLSQICRARSAITTESCISYFREKHGDRYDYSKFEYFNARTKGIIICKEHGEFLMQRISHLRGRGCPQCGRISQGLKQRGRKLPPHPSKGKGVKYDLDLIKEMYRSGETYQNIVLKTGIKIQTLRTYKSRGKLD